MTVYYCSPENIYKYLIVNSQFYIIVVSIKLIEIQKIMNLTKVLKNMEQLNSKQQDIQKKYSLKNKKRNIYYSTLKASDEEDLKIYGYTHDNMIEKFKRKFRNTAQSSNTIDNNQNQKELNKQIVRSKTAKPARPKTGIKTQLSSDKILGSRKSLQGCQLETYTKKCIDDDGASINNNNNLDTRRFLNLFADKKQGLSSKYEQIKRKSIKKYKKQFNRDFQSDIKISKAIRQKESKTIAIKTVKFEPNRLSNCNSQNNNNRQCNSNGYGQVSTNNSYKNTQQKTVQNKQNVFQLTQQITTKNYFTSTSVMGTMTLHQQNKFYRQISSYFGDYQLNFMDRFLDEMKITDQQAWYAMNKHVQVVCYLVQITEMNILQIAGYKLELIGKYISQMLSQNKKIHLSVFQKDENNYPTTLLYQEFIVKQKKGEKKTSEICFHILKYWFCLFLLMDKETHSVKTALKTSLMFFQNLKKIPKAFQLFLADINHNKYVIRENTKLTHRYRFKQIYDLAVQRMQIENKRMSQKMAVLAQNDRKTIQRYFYICFLQFLVYYIYVHKLQINQIAFLIETQNLQLATLYCIYLVPLRFIIYN